MRGDRPLYGRASISMDGFGVLPEPTFKESEVNEAKCEICGEPMPAGEEMFKFHGYSGKCPKPPMPKLSKTQEQIRQQAEQLIADAEAAGMVVTIELESLQPLAMGNHRMVAAVAPRHPY